MTFPDAVRTVLTQKYMDFTGRAARSEFWWFTLAYLIGAIIVSFIPFLPILYALGMLLPFLAVGFRRMHDIGKPGWYFVIPTAYQLVGQLLGFGPNVPIDPATGAPLEVPSGMSVMISGIFGLVGLAITILFIWWLTRPSQPETNQYGPPPAT